MYNEECSEKLFDLIPVSRFYYRTSQHQKGAHPHIIDTWVDLFSPILASCGIHLRYLSRKTYYLFM